MTTVRHLGTANPATPFATIERRSIAVNTANRQIAVGDENAGTAGVPLSLIAVRYFDVRGIYAINDLVVNNGGLFRAVTATGPGAFTTAHWVDVSGTVMVADSPPAAAQGSLWWESDTGILWLYYNDGNTGQWVQAGGAAPTDPNKVSKTGDTMSGALAISATTPSTSPATGAFTVAGGVGVGGAIQTAGNMIMSKATPQVVLNKSASGQANSIVGQTTTFNRWLLRIGNDIAETGFDAGSNFDLWRYNDAGALSRALLIERATGNVGIDATTASTSPTTGALVVAGGVGIGGAINNYVASGFNATFDAPTNSQLQFKRNAVAMWYIGAGAASGSNGNFNFYSATSATFPFVITVAGNSQFTGSVYLSGTVAAPGPSNNSLGTTFAGILYHSTAGLGMQLNAQTAGAIIGFHCGGVNVGSIAVNGTSTGYNTTSDARLKEDLKPFDAGHIIDDTEVYDFRWKSTGERSYGVIAQQAAEVYATPSFHDEDQDRWYIDYSKYVPVMLQELKSLRARIAEFERRLAKEP
jgi:hypothetical protein